MNQSDQELLDKQLRGLYPPPRRDGMLIMTIVAVFFGGLALGSLLFGHNEPTRTASNESALSSANGAPLTARP